MTITQSYTIKKLISPLTSVIRGDANTTLGGVLSRVRSSHEAVFIFNDDNKFLGLISPYKTLYSKNYPYTTKVSSITFTPPTITKETPLYQVAKHMLATKIYSLPVFSESGSLEGVVHGRDILQEIIKQSDLLEFVSSRMKLHQPVTAPITASVKDVFYDLREKGVSRMVLVTATGSLAGIVTRSDLMRTLIKPTSKMRFPSEGSRAGFYSLAGEKKFRKSESVRKYYTSLIDSLPADTPMDKIVTHLIASPHNSIVLVDGRGKPTGFLSVRDILKAITLLRPEKDVPLMIKNPGTSVSEQELVQATQFLKLFAKKLSKRMQIEKIEITSTEPKNPKGHTKMHNITVVVTPVAGQSFVATVKRRKYIDGIQGAGALIEKQRKRSGLSKRGALRR